MSRWIDHAQIKESIDNFQSEVSSEILAYMSSELIDTSKTIPADPNQLYRFNTAPKNLETVYKNLLQMNLNYGLSDIYVLNGDGLRSDEFTTRHDGKHILFAGCSVTAGEGLLLEQTWAYKTYLAISEGEKVSGFFNIAVPGMSILEIFSQVFRYISKYGIPSDIFISLPDPEREYYYLSGLDFRQRSDLDGIDDPMKLVNISQVNNFVIASYKSLVEYCKLANIRLHLQTWSPTEWRYGLEHDTGDPRAYFSNLNINSKEKEIAKHCKKFAKQNSNNPFKEYFYDALDELHFGIAIHDYFYKIAYNQFKN